MLSSILNFYLVNSIFCISPKDLVEQLGFVLAQTIYGLFSLGSYFFKVSQISSLRSQLQAGVYKTSSRISWLSKRQKRGKKGKKSICSSNTNIPNNHGYECTGCYVLACK